MTGCFQMVAFVPSIITGATTGNALQTSISYAFNYQVKKSTGKTPMEHVINVAEKNEKAVMEALNKDLVSTFAPIDENQNKRLLNID